MVEQGNLGVKSGTGWIQYTPGRITAIRESLTAELVHQLQRDHSILPPGGQASPA